jgi:hypothetical protein
VLVCNLTLLSEVNWGAGRVNCSCSITSTGSQADASSASQKSRASSKASNLGMADVSVSLRAGFYEASVGISTSTDLVLEFNGFENVAQGSIRSKIRLEQSNLSKVC